MNAKDLSSGVLFVISKKNALNSIIKYAEFIEQLHGNIPYDYLVEIKRDLEKFQEMYGRDSMLCSIAFLECGRRLKQ